MAETTTRSRDEDGEGFTAEERAAMKERATEVRRKGGKKKDGLADLMEKVAEMDEADRAIAERLHELIMETAPELEPKTWYGQPAYAKGGKVVCFFQAASKFKTRYATFGFQETARLDDGPMWATSFAIARMTPEVERTVVELVAKAAG